MTASTGPAALRSWERSLVAPVCWDGVEVWVLGDLLPENRLVVGGQQSAVTDFGGLDIGDPACDLRPLLERFRRQQPQRLPRRAAGPRGYASSWPRLGLLPGPDGDALLLGDQLGHRYVGPACHGSYMLTDE